jgi:hypothetical protein
MEQQSLMDMFALVAFEHGGAAQKVVCFGTEKYGAAKGISISISIDLPSGTWHIIIVMVQDSVLLERKAGPFDPRQPKTIALGTRWGIGRCFPLSSMVS